MLKYCAWLFAFTLLAGCAAKPTHVILAPQVNQQTPVYSGQPATFSVVDNRVGSHLVQILKQGEAATLYQPQSQLTQVLQQSLTRGWSQQGLAINNFSSTQLTLFIDEALVSVQQQSFEYQSNKRIQLRLVVETASSDKTQKVEKSYTINGSGSGKLSADLAVLERDFNNMLSTVINQILADNEIQQTIKKA